MLPQTEIPSTARKVVLKCFMDGRFTLHAYVRDSVLGDVRHLVFACEFCKTERQYGCEGR